MECDIAIVGGGVLGVTTAYWLSAAYDRSVVVVEKDAEVATRTTLRNTGVVHRPYYMDPSKKRAFALAAERSFHMWKRLAAERRLPWKEVGTLMVATDARQVKSLERYTGWAMENGMEEGELRLLDSGEARREEPEVRCEGAVLSTRDTSTDFAALTRVVWEAAERNGARIMRSSEVERATEDDVGVELRFRGGGSLRCSFMVNAAGGGSLRLAHMMGLAREYAVLHFRGEYWVVDAGRAPRVSRNIYSVARHTEYNFLDPHLIVKASGRREVGPNAVLVAGPEAYTGTGGAVRLLEKLFERPITPKMRLFLNATFLSLAWDEWESSLSKDAMCRRVKGFVPALDPGMLVEHGLAGVRSSLVGREGFVPEAIMVDGRHSLHILNYNSPGATGAPAFSERLVERLAEGGHLGAARSGGQKSPLWEPDLSMRP